MQNAIKVQIKRLCTRAIQKAERQHLKDLEYREKFVKRTNSPAKPSKPKSAPLHRHFDPIYCKRHASFLAKSIWHKILIGEYEPAAAMQFDIPKAGGGTRGIMQFSIPDAAVAATLHRRLTFRNLKKQSGNSFAYRPDKNVFDAILKLKTALGGDGRAFVIQLDFENYFDSIPHGYIRDLLKKRELITLSTSELKTIDAFLQHYFASKSAYLSGPWESRKRGTPQGSAISLTLANLANHPLDERLETLNGQFVRYADDTVVVCYTYEDALKAYDCFSSHCAKSGLRLNEKKSPGICIFSNGPEEFRSIESFKFLGYGIEPNGLFMHSSVEERLKRKLSNLINIYLLQYIDKAKPPNPLRAGVDFDWDLMGLLSEVRMILYGGLSETDLRSFVRNGVRLPKMRGLMGFYALLDNKEALTRLDGWLVSTIKQAYKKRAHIFLRYGYSTPPMNSKTLLLGSWYDAIKYNVAGFAPDQSLPSFVRGWAAARKYYYSFGLESIEPPKYVGYY